MADNKNHPAAGTVDTKERGEESLSDILRRLPVFKRNEYRKSLSPEQLAQLEREETENEMRVRAERAMEEEATERRQLADRVAMLTRQLGERYSPERCNLDTFRLTVPEKQKPVIQRLREISSSLRKFVDDGHGLVFIGSVGTGKDHLAASMLYTAIRDFKIDSKWVNGRMIFQASRDAIHNDSAESEMIEPFLKPTILCISDPVPIGGTLSSWNVDLLYRLIDVRYHRMRPTWMTINVQTADEADKCLTPPVWDRLRDGAEIIRCFWPSFRRESR
jgi:DNA replication protein DnaC